MLISIQHFIFYLTAFFLFIFKYFLKKILLILFKYPESHAAGAEEKEPRARLPETSPQRGQAPVCRTEKITTALKLDFTPHSELTLIRALLQLFNQNQS